MRILIIGGTGQIGSELTSQLSTTQSTYSMTSKDLDIRDFNSLCKKFREINPQVVINAAAFTDVNLAEKEQKLAASINSEGVRNLAKLCKEFSILLIHISTDYVFSGDNGDSYKETDQTEPLNIYGVSKLNGENAILELSDKYIILRTSWVFGNGKNFVKTIVNMSKTRSDLSVINDQFGGPTSAQSIARCIKVLIEKYFDELILDYGIFHFCGYPKINWHEFAKKICLISKEKNLIDSIPKINPVTSEFFDSNVKRPKNSYLNCKKIENVFGIKQPNWEKDLNLYLERYGG